MNHYFEVLQKYAVFNGRAARPEFWYFTLINLIIIIVLRVINQPLGIYDGTYFGVLDGLYWLAVFLPSIGVQIRRLHDTGRTGWWVLLLLFPILGSIVLIVLWALEGEPGSNEYGPPPTNTAPGTSGTV